MRHEKEPAPEENEYWRQEAISGVKKLVGGAAMLGATFIHHEIPAEIALYAGGGYMVVQSLYSDFQRRRNRQ